jgi:hypothetical protein
VGYKFELNRDTEEYDEGAALFSGLCVGAEVSWVYCTTRQVYEGCNYCWE